MVTARNILLIEDKSSDIERIKHCVSLNNEEVRIECMSRWQDVSALPVNYRPDAILLDNDQPGNDGVVTVDAVRQQFADCPIIVLAGGSDNGTSLTLLHSRLEECLSKMDIDASILMRVLRYSMAMDQQSRAEHDLARLQQEMRIAREIQFRLFPAQPPILPNFEIAGATYPAELVDGDYFDYLSLPDGCLAIVVADACGHGLPASLLMVQTQSYLHAFAEVESDIAVLLNRTSNVLHRSTHSDRFVTLAIVKVDPVAHTFSYCNAGHPSSYLIGRNGELRAELRSCGLPLGVQHDATYRPTPAAKLHGGDLLLMLTDGVFEASLRTDGGRRLSMQDVLDAVSKAKDAEGIRVIEALYQRVLEQADGDSLSDDITAVVVRSLCDQPVV